MKRQLYIFLALVAGLKACSTIYAADPAKSDYYFMEALRQDALENQDASMALMRRAYELNPESGSVAAKVVAFSEISLAGSDSIRFNEGVKMAQRYVDANPKDSYAGVSLADIYSRCGRPDLAKPLYATAYALHAESPSLGLRLAQTLAATEQPDSALSVLHAIESINGVNIMTAYPICHILLIEKADTLAAIAEVDKLLAAFPTDPDAVTLATATYQRIDQPGRAIEVLNQVIDTDPTELPLHTYRLYLAAKQEDKDAVRQGLLSTIECDDLSQTDVEQVLGYFAAEICGFDSIWIPEMLKGADAAERRFPRSVVPDLLRVHASEINKNFDEAIKNLKLALKKAPERSDLWARLVTFIRVQGDENEAIKVGYQALKECSDDDSELRMVLTGALVMEKRYKEAVDLIKPLALDDTLEPQERSEYLCTLGDCLQNYEPADSAAVYYEQAIELDPTNILAKNNYAYMISEMGGNLDLAERLINEVMAVEPHNPTYLDTAAWVAYKQGKYALANIFIDEAMALDNSESEELQAHAAAIKAELEK